MAEFVMLTRLHSGAIQSPKSLEALEKQVMDRIRSECPDIQWIHNYAVLGPWDYLDIFSAPDDTAAFKVATIVRSFGHAHTEVWSARSWGAFKDMIRELPEGR